jgi:glutaminyl-peptide cyclotransferase
MTIHTNNPVRLLKALTLFLSAALISATAAPPAFPPIAFKVEAKYPHDRAAYTEGLFVRDGFLYESTGREGESDIRRVHIADGKVLQSVKLPPRLFGEGIVDWKNEIISVTWQTGAGFRWDLRSLQRKSNFSYPGEGWGMTQDGTNLIMSDGTPQLRLLDPISFKERGRITVTIGGRPLPQLNEIEWVNGVIYANVWMTNEIVRINPVTGVVTGILNLTEIAKQVPRRDRDSVLNGIAYDAKSKQLLVTGKNWPTLFALKLLD